MGMFGIQRIVVVGAAVAGAALLASAAWGQDLRVPEATNLFISPSGEPFFAPKADPYPLVKWFRQADANGDGKLDADEMRKDADRFFKTLDRNGDGYIDGQEISYYENRVVPEILAPSPVMSVEEIPDPDAPQKLNGNQGAVFYSLFREPEPVRSADRNFDYRVSLQEFEALSDRHFKVLDKAGAGFLTIADLPKTEAEKFAKAHR
jgi:hypothetical protein